MNQKIDKEKKWDLKIVLISAVVGGAIALASNFVTFYFTKVQRNSERKETLLDKKIELIDKTTRVVYKFPSVQETFSHALRNDTVKFDLLVMPYLEHKDLNLIKELGELRAEFYAILVQDQLYFGDKTRHFIDSVFNKDNPKYKRTWWQTPDTTYRQLVEVMMSEL
jgi:hypothetical protein